MAAADGGIVGGHRSESAAQTVVAVQHVWLSHGPVALLRCGAPNFRTLNSFGQTRWPFTEGLGNQPS